MRIVLFSFLCLFLLLDGNFARSSASTVYFLVAEWPGRENHFDSYVAPLSDPADIAHARDLIARGPVAAGRAILAARIAKGANDVNRDYRDSYRRQWSWHVSDVEGFGDMAIEVCDGWPAFVESDVDYWVNNVGAICFWSYTVVAELGDLSVPRDLAVVKGGSGQGAITSSPAGINCGTDCTEVYDDWTEITLTAVPEAGSTFQGWSGGGCSGTGSCTFRMASDISVSATFAASSPLAGFEGTPRTGNAPLIVGFTDLSTGGPTSWLWDFGDSTTATERNPAHVYEQAGTYSVSLTAMNGTGSDTETMNGYISTGSCGNLPVKVGNVFHTSLQGAYDDPATSTGNTIEIQAVTFAADVDLWRDLAVTFAGGNNCEYATQAMGTTINGSLTISNGSAAVSNVRIK